VSGTLELTKLHNEWTGFVKEKPTLLQFCVPDSGIPVIQAMRVVVKYLKEHPEQLHEDGMGLTVAALKDSFPCK
jgi:anti-sigma regulatory factor (Ser/Thr protein kinase)